MHDDVTVHEIDLASFRDGTERDRAEVARAFDVAGCDNGFIRLVGHGVDWSLVERAFDAWQAFFDRPLDEKVAYAAGPEADGMVGYTEYGKQALAYTAGEASPPDLLEAYSVGREDIDGPFFDE